jgi:hypothetical protein
VVTSTIVTNNKGVKPPTYYWKDPSFWLFERHAARLVGTKTAAVYRSIKARARVDESGRAVAYPSYEAIAEDAGLSRATVGRAVAALKSAGWIKVESKPPDANFYVLIEGGVDFAITKIANNVLSGEKVTEGERKEWVRFATGSQGAYLQAQGEMVTGSQGDGYRLRVSLEGEEDSKEKKQEKVKQQVEAPKLPADQREALVSASEASGFVATPDSYKLVASNSEAAPPPSAAAPPSPAVAVLGLDDLEGQVRALGKFYAETYTGLAASRSITIPLDFTHPGNVKGLSRILAACGDDLEHAKDVVDAYLWDFVPRRPNAPAPYLHYLTTSALADQLSMAVRQLQTQRK